jgi:GNAT superfamily N-acetyltransferase
MERFDITTQQERRRVGPLFDGIHNSLIQTFLQGYAGKAFCDDLTFPRCAAIRVRGFLFLGGDPRCENAREFAGEALNTPDDSVIIACDDEWLNLMEQAHAGKFTRGVRFATERRPEGFDKEHLRALMRGVPAEYTLLGMDEEIYEAAMAEDWSRDLCSFFPDADDYVERGIGFCVLKDERLVAGASSFSLHDDGLCVRVATQEDHRRKGLAKACAAALVLSCVSQKRVPSFDAPDAVSLTLAKDLGYKLRNEYPCLYSKPA